MVLDDEWWSISETDTEDWVPLNPPKDYHRHHHLATQHAKLRLRASGHDCPAEEDARPGRMDSHTALHLLHASRTSHGSKENKTDASACSRATAMGGGGRIHWAFGRGIRGDAGTGAVRGSESTWPMPRQRSAAQALPFNGTAPVTPADQPDSAPDARATTRHGPLAQRGSGPHPHLLSQRGRRARYTDTMILILARYD